MSGHFEIDERFRGVRGTYQTQTRSTNIQVGTLDEMLVGNGARIRIALAATFALAATVADWVAIGTREGSNFVPFVTLTPAAPCAVVRLEDVGDCLFQAIIASAIAAGDVALSVTEVIWERGQL